MSNVSFEAAEARISEISPTLAQVLKDPNVVEVSCNPGGAVFVERFKQSAHQEFILEGHEVLRFLRWIGNEQDIPIRAEHPILSAVIPGMRHRVEGLAPGTVDRPAFSIRCHRQLEITLLDFCDGNGKLDEQIRGYIGAKRSILVAGGTSSGKTTLTNAMLAALGEIDPQARVLMVEDTPELRAPLKNTVSLRAGTHCSLQRCLESTLRLAPDRIMLGEVRAGDALVTLLKLWNTGHPGGMTTLHANSAEDVMNRLDLMASEVLARDPRPFLTSALDVVVFVTRGTGAPTITTILEMNNGTFETAYTRA